MANQEHVDKLLKEGVSAWNKWRQENPEISPDLEEADFESFNFGPSVFGIGDGADVNLEKFKDAPVGTIIKEEPFNKKLDNLGANLEGVNLKGANLKYSRLVGVNLKGACLDGAYLEEADFVGQRAKFEHDDERIPLKDGLIEVKLNGASFENTNLKRANFTNAYIEGAIFINTIFNGAIFTGARLKDAIFSETDLEGAFLIHANLEGANLYKTNLSGAILPNAIMRRSDLNNTNLYDAKATGARLEYADLREANLKDADLKGAVLMKADLQDAVLWNSKLQGADLRKADLRKTDLRKANFKGAKLQGTVLKQSRLQSAYFAMAIVDGGTFISNCKIDEITDFTGVGLDSVTIDPGLKTALKDNIRRIHWNMWFDNERESGKWFIPGLVQWFWWITEYGSSTKSIIICFIKTAIFFGIVYWLFEITDHSIIHELGKIESVDKISNLHIFFRSMYFSIVTMTTLGFGDMHAAKTGNWLGVLGYAVLSLQVITGYVLLGALITRLGIIWQNEAPAQKSVITVRESNRFILLFDSLPSWLKLWNTILIVVTLFYWARGA